MVAAVVVTMAAVLGWAVAKAMEMAPTVTEAVEVGLGNPTVGEAKEKREAGEV